MPVGNSITWGKVNNGPPPPGTEGYRKPLHEKLTDAGISVEFVGDSGSVENSGHFFDNARIRWFHPDTVHSITAELIQYQPDIVILHVGTNDIGTSRPLGNYNSPGSIMNHLYTLVTAIVDNPNVEDLLLCKVIPKFSSPGEEVETVDYNNAIEIMLNELETAQRAKITLIDMWTPFYANKTSYYNIDVDKVHPSSVGYNYMATVFYHHISNILVPSFTDEFDRPAAPLNGSDGWVAAPDIRIVNVNENGGGAIQCMRTNDPQLRWNNLCVWGTSKNLTTVSVTIDLSSNPTACDKFGVAVGLDTLKATASGYMVWVYQGFVRVNTIVGGDANSGVPVPNALEQITPLQPGNRFKVSYRPAPDANYFTITVDGGDPIVLRDPNRWAGNGDNLYSGVLFRGSDTAQPFNIKMDNFGVESQLPDVIPPGLIWDFNTFTQGNTSITFQWTAPGGDDYTGKASSYDLRYATTSIEDGRDFANANIIPDVPQPSDAGTVEIFTASGLLPATRYYFRIRAIDTWGNKGELSNEIVVRTNSIGQVEETFDRPPEPDGIGDDWLIDPTEYTIVYNEGTGEGEFTNYQNGGWGRVAIYLARRNPAMVKMVWGRQATSTDGGMALMLTSSSLTADGYLLWVERWLKVISLYEIDNGDVVPAPGGVIDQIPYTLLDNEGNLDFPGSLDTLSVVMDWNNPAGHKFDVFVNGKPAANRALYDAERRYSSTTKYAGLMLRRLGGENNVTGFLTLSEQGGAAGIQAVSGMDQTGVVASTLPEPLRVEVRDANNAPVPNAPVEFTVIEPSDASVTAPGSVDNNIRIEAEWGDLSGAYTVRSDDPGAAGGEYITALSGTGEAVYEFWVDKDTTYWFWVRLISPNFWQSAVSIQVDGGETWIWNTNLDHYSSQWQWDRIADMRYVPQGEIKSKKLSRSIHRIRIIKGHNDVRIDKLLITPSSSYIPTGTETVEQLMTDSEGIASTSLTLGTKVGINRVQARPFGTADFVEFLATGIPDSPVSMTKTNDGQSGAARDTLDLPFIVTLYDQYGNTTPDVQTTFTVIGGGGSVTADTSTTDENGQAQTFLVLGAASSINRVRATFAGYAGQEVVFTATTTEGLVSRIESVPGQGAGQKHYVNQVLPNYLRIRVYNDKDQLMDQVPVQFEVIDGDGRAGRVQPKWTNSQGIAQDTLYLGPTASIVTVMARIGNVQDTVVVDSAFYRGARLSYYSGDRQTAWISDTLYFRLKARVFDDVNRPVAGHPVSFATRGQGFEFLDGSDSVVVRTSVSGIAQTNIRVAAVHGVYTDIVQAWSSNGFYMIPESPVKYTLFAKSQAARIKKIQGDTTWVVRERIPDPLKVQMVTAQDEPVDNQPVIFTIKQGGGQFEGTLMPTTTVMTDGDGFAQISFVLGSMAGFKNNVIEAVATNGVDPLHGSPITFRISAQSSAADSMSALSDTYLTGVVGKRLSQPVQVLVTDRHGNPVSGERVMFSIVSRGGGTLDTLNAVTGSADTSKTVFIRNAAGIAAIVWTLGDTAGTWNNALEVRSNNGLINLKGAPVRFYASGVPDVVSASRSMIDATGPVPATGVDSSYVTVTLTDGHGNPVAGKRVSLNVTGGVLNFIQQPIVPTDTMGRAVGYLQSLSAGEKTIQAIDIDDNVLLDQKESVIFLANDAAKILSYSGDGQSGNVGTVLAESLAVKVTDANNNPVAYGPVYYEVIGGGGRIIEDQPVVSDSNGLAYSRLVLGPVPGENMVKVTSQGLLGSPLYFSATGKVGQPISMFFVSGHGQTGKAGEVLEQPFVVGVRDIEGDVVAGIDILYEVDIGGGSLITPQPVRTNEWGAAQSYFRAGTLSGTTSWVKATNINLSGSPVMFSVATGPGPARKIVYVSGSGQSGYVDGAVQNPLVAQVTDRYNNPVGGVNVRFTVVKGDATLQVGESQSGTTVVSQTNTQGRASVYVTLGRSTETITIHATSSLLQGSPVEFTLHVQSLQAASIEKFGGDNQKGTVNHPFVDPLSVRVLDAYRNPVRGIQVYFTKNSGGGAIVESQPVVSDNMGVASVHFMAGSSPGTSVVSALWVNRVVTFTLETVYNYNFPHLDKNIISSSYDVYEGDELLIPMVASDADLDELTFRIADPFPPAGAKVEPQSPTTAVFRWTPNYDQNGTYTITLQVLDGRGGSDEATVTVNVLNSNRAPVIYTAIPTQDTTLSAGQTVTFWVDARDLDGDALHYAWKVDGESKGSDSPVFDYFIDKYFLGTMAVDVFVNDGIAVISHRWILDVSTAVQISDFTARFSRKTMAVLLRWVTSHEQDNIGFDVYRSYTADGDYVKINDQQIPSQQGGEYAYTDASIHVGQTYYYKIVNTDVRKNEMEYGPVMIQVPVPQRFELSQNYPNPFNPVTTIQYQLPRRERVQLTIYNMMGQRVVTLVDSEQEPGYYVVEWDGRNQAGQEVSTGIYIYQLRARDETVTRRMIKLQ